MKSLLQDITIYHKNGSNYTRYNLKASVRNTSYRNRNATGVNTSDNALIRIFDIKGYSLSWKVSKGDIIVSRNAQEDIIKAPITELRKIYGEPCVFEVTSVEEFIFDNTSLNQINHIKIGAK